MQLGQVVHLALGQIGVGLHHDAGGHGGPAHQLGIGGLLTTDHHHRQAGGQAGVDTVRPGLERRAPAPPPHPRRRAVRKVRPRSAGTGWPSERRTVGAGGDQIGVGGRKQKNRGPRHISTVDREPDPRRGCSPRCTQRAPGGRRRAGPVRLPWRDDHRRPTRGARRGLVAIRGRNPELTGRGNVQLRGITDTAAVADAVAAAGLLPSASHETVRNIVALATVRPGGRARGRPAVGHRELDPGRSGTSRSCPT